MYIPFAGFATQNSSDNSVAIFRIYAQTNISIKIKLQKALSGFPSSAQDGNRPRLDNRAVEYENLTGPRDKSQNLISFEKVCNIL